MKDDLGTRMKTQYEMRTRTYLPRRTYTILRLDGKAFHTYTRKCTRPYDGALVSAMDDTTRALCEQIQGVVFAYVQSDEMSLLLQDFAKIETDAWFDGQVQKMVSISASIASAEFNHIRDYDKAAGLISDLQHPHLALFDARVFTIPDKTEVANYFIWRQKDATRNSLQMLAQHYFSSKELHGKSQADIHDMLHGVGVNWNNQPAKFKRGRFITKVMHENGRHYWHTDAPEIWTQSTQLQELIPTLGESE